MSSPRKSQSNPIPVCHPTTGPEKHPRLRPKPARGLCTRSTALSALVGRVGRSLLIFSWLLLHSNVILAVSPVIGGLDRLTSETSSMAGHVLISELACTACHKSDMASWAAKPGPDLSQIANRASLPHLERFLLEPSAVKPGTTMPNLLNQPEPEERARVARAIIHHLATLGENPPQFEPPDLEAVARGEALYHAVGCVACHSPETSLPNSIPLGALDEKYSIPTLTAFLEDPLGVRHAGRMPDFDLNPFEAADIANYLLREQTSLARAPQHDPLLAEQGRELFIQHRCQACHSAGDTLPVPTAPPLEAVRIQHGCLSEELGDHPHYPLDAGQREALERALENPTESWSPRDHVSFTLTQFHCVACHRREGFRDIPDERRVYFTGEDEHMGDQGRLPPPLSGVGAKLKPGALRDVLVHGHGVRPYLNVRMPRFSRPHMETLATQFKATDTLPTKTFTPAPEESKPTQVGRMLAGNRGFNCVACHTFRGQSAAEIRAVDLMTLAERLEMNWFHQYLIQPQRFSPLTIMPDFWPDGLSPLTDILDGDPDQQRDALWQYLAQGPEAGEPAGLVLEPLIVTVEDQAVMIRRAFPGIGKRGIAVGYPSGIHLAFDATQMRLGTLWWGGFIEASGIWRGQGAGTARPLGRHTVNFPTGPAFAELKATDADWPDFPTHHTPDFAFKGYVLDNKQRPTFRYVVRGMAVEDRFLDRKDASGKPYFERTLTFSEKADLTGHYLRIAVAPEIGQESERHYRVGEFLELRLSAEGWLRTLTDSQELLLPINPVDSVVIEYHLKGAP